MLKIVDTKLPKDVFGVKPNLSLLAQAIHVYEERNHVGLRSTKTRSEINRTTKKIYKQKGTGGARHGSRRANLYVGGGVVFGPRPIRRILSLSQTLKNKAKVSAFSAKAGEKEVMVIGGVAKIAKTGEVSEFLKKIKAKRFTFILSEKSKDAVRFLRNLGRTKAVFYKDANALDIVRGGMLLVDQEIFIKEPKVEKVAKTSKVKAGKVVKK